MEDVQVLDTIPNEDLNVFSVDVCFKLKKSLNCIHTDVISLMYYEEDEDARSAREIRQHLENIFKDNNIGYCCKYVDPVTFDYRHYILVALTNNPIKINEQIKELIKDVKDITIGRFYIPNLDESDSFNDLFAINEARNKLLKIMLGKCK